MATLKIEKVAIRGISAAVPKNVVKTIEMYNPEWGKVEDFISSTGIVERRVAADQVCTSDLCVAAAEKLIVELKWSKSDIGAIVLVTQTPDFLFCPATACLIQERLKLPISCLAFDVNLGCSGWVYGLSIVSSMMQSGTIKKAILLVGDTPTKHNSSKDGSAFPLFGDAGTATALEYDSEWKEPMWFTLSSDGSGWDAITIHEGGFRTPFNEHSLIVKDYGDGHLRKGVEVAMDGMTVFSFAISKVPKSLKTLMAETGNDNSTINVVTLHQANRMINDIIIKKIKLDADKMGESLSSFGNTSCASIPLTLVYRNAETLKSSKIRHLASGFGVGLSWGGVIFTTNNIVIPKIIEV